MINATKDARTNIEIHFATNEIIYLGRTVPINNLMALFSKLHQILNKQSQKIKEPHETTQTV